LVVFSHFLHERFGLELGSGLRLGLGQSCLLAQLLSEM